MSRVLVVFLVTLGTASADSVNDSPAQAMAHAIARMMESMGFNGSASYGAPGYPDPAGMAGWPSGMGVPPVMQGGETSPMGQMGRMGEQVYRGMQGMARETPWAGSSLEGVWEDNQGGLLIVQGGFYRLYAQCRGYLEGAIRISGDRVELSNTQEDSIQTFEMALDQGRLALRDPGGQVFLYRRLVLGAPK